MLVLSRKKDQSIMIGNDIKINIVSVSEGKVKIGIEAPREIDVQRGEIFEAIQNENKISAKAKANQDVVLALEKLINN